MRERRRRGGKGKKQRLSERQSQKVGRRVRVRGKMGEERCASDEGALGRKRDRARR